MSAQAIKVKDEPVEDGALQTSSSSHPSAKSPPFSQTHSNLQTHTDDSGNLADTASSTFSTSAGRISDSLKTDNKRISLASITADDGEIRTVYSSIESISPRSKISPAMAPKRTNKPFVVGPSDRVTRSAARGTSVAPDTNNPGAGTGAIDSGTTPAVPETAAPSVQTKAAKVTKPKGKKASLDTSKASKATKPTGKKATPDIDNAGNGTATTGTLASATTTAMPDTAAPSTKVTKPKAKKASGATAGPPPTKITKTTRRARSQSIAATSGPAIKTEPATADAVHPELPDESVQATATAVPQASPPTIYTGKGNGRVVEPPVTTPEAPSIPTEEGQTYTGKGKGKMVDPQAPPSEIPSIPIERAATTAERPSVPIERAATPVERATSVPIETTERAATPDEEVADAPAEITADAPPAPTTGSNGRPSRATRGRGRGTRAPVPPRAAPPPRAANTRGRGTARTRATRANSMPPPQRRRRKGPVPVSEANLWQFDSQAVAKWGIQLDPLHEGDIADDLVGLGVPLRKVNKMRYAAAAPIGPDNPALDGFMQRPFTADWNPTAARTNNRNAPANGGPSRPGVGTRATQQQSAKYQHLIIGKNPSWVLIDPNYPYDGPDDDVELPAIMHPHRWYEPGNKKIVLFNLKSRSIAFRSTPEVLVGKKVKYTAAGLCIVETESKKRQREEEPEQGEAGPSQAPPAAKRKRGRPKKTVTPATVEESEEEAGSEE